MKNIRKALIIALMSIPVIGIAQVPVNGYLLSRTYFDVQDMVQLSQYNGGFSTARSSAMGGAFTSLGADLSSMNINPAGLGLYRSSEFSVTPSIMFGKINNSHPEGITGVNNGKTRFALNNVGIALNLYESSYKPLTSFTFGFSYNKLADFNYQSTVGLNADRSSLAFVFEEQLLGIPKDWLENTGRPFNRDDIYVDEWGAVLGYKTGLIEEYVNDEDPDDKFYLADKIGNDAVKTHMARTDSRGYIGEYNISAGFNFRNVVYVGFGLGIQDIYQKQTVRYEEIYSNNRVDDPATSMNYNQYLRMSGSGVNFKFGVIANPVAGLRVGLAVHTPYYVNINKKYAANMVVRYADGSNGNQDTPTNSFDYKFQTPTRLLAGVSYAFGNWGLISVDYERNWMDGMKIKISDDPDTEDDYKTRIKNDFHANNIVKVGAEFRPIPELALRAGFAHSGTILNDSVKDAVFESPIAYKYSNISAGVGYRFGQRTTLDLTYVYMNVKHTPYDLYYFDGGDDTFNYYAISEYGVSQKTVRNNLILTLGVRF